MLAELACPETRKEYLTGILLSLLPFMTMIIFFLSPGFLISPILTRCCCYFSVTSPSEPSVNIYFYRKKLVAYTEEEEEEGEEEDCRRWSDYKRVLFF